MFKVSKVLDRRSDINGRVQYLLRWKGYGSKHDSWVDEDDVNEAVKFSYFRIQGNRRVIQSIEVLISQRLNVRHCQAAFGRVKRQVSIILTMEMETFADIFGRLPTAPPGLRQQSTCRFSVPAAELDLVFSEGWWKNTFYSSSTICRVMRDKDVKLCLYTKKKVFHDHSSCPSCTSTQLLHKCKPVKRIVAVTSFMKMSFFRERSKQRAVNIETPKLDWAE